MRVYKKVTRLQLLSDKRVKVIVSCKKCKTPITGTKSKRNKGLCDDCTPKNN